MGSGTVLSKAIKEDGIRNFKKKILHVFDNEKDMWEKEKELVLLNERTYNIQKGGFGGFDYINNNGKNGAKLLAEKLKTDKEYATEFKKKISEAMKIHYSNNGSHWLGRKHKEESKRKVGLKNSVHQKGKGNSQYGTIWITDGKINKKIKKKELQKHVDFGFHRGRTLR